MKACRTLYLEIQRQVNPINCIIEVLQNSIVFTLFIESALTYITYRHETLTQNELY